MFCWFQAGLLVSNCAGRTWPRQPSGSCGSRWWSGYSWFRAGGWETVQRASQRFDCHKSSFTQLHCYCERYGRGSIYALGDFFLLHSSWLEAKDSAVEAYLRKSCHATEILIGVILKSLQELWIMQACEFSNLYAPEHLIVNVEDAENWLDHLDNAGNI